MNVTPVTQMMMNGFNSILGFIDAKALSPIRFLFSKMCPYSSESVWVKQKKVEKIEKADPSSNLLIRIAHSVSPYLEMQPVRAGVHTIYDFLRTKIAGAIPYTPHTDFSKHLGQKRIAERQMLTSSDVQFFLEGLKKNKPFNQIDIFYFAGIDGESLGEILEKLNNTFDRKNFDRSLPMILPITFKNWIKHIVLISVKDGVVEYFDSKGNFPSPKIEGMINHCKEKLNAQSIHKIQPAERQQYDSHTCGVHVCKRIDQLIIENKTIGVFEKSIPSNQELDAFRQRMIEIAYS